VGYWKDRMIKEHQQGWNFVDDNLVVCAKCFEDYAIKNFILDNATAKKCSYCKRRSKNPIAAPLNDVLGLIGEGLNFEYADPAEENARDDGEWVIEPRDTDDVFAGLDPITENMDVYDDIIEAFRDSFWVDKPLWAPSEDDELRYGWRDFVKAVKFQRRYVFLKRKKKQGFSSGGGITPDKMLDHIGEVIREVGLVSTMEAGTGWFRARQHKPAQKYTSAADLGTVPRKYAQSSNRMSPAGIPMFYGAGDADTATAETYTPTPGQAATVTVAKFETARDALVVDLTALPEFPSLFDERRRHLRAPVGFLRGFVEDLAKPIKKDGREHIEYVPTQIVTEYIRHIFRTDTGQRVRGVVYRSSRKKRGKCCVLWVRNKQCCEAKAGWQDEETDGVISKKRKKYWLGLTGKPKRFDYP
jgi:HEPN/RES N-terminal domain 1/RES domain